MVNVRVRNEDLLQREPKVSQPAVNAPNFVAGINDNRFPTLLVAKNGAVTLQRADGKSLENHEPILGGSPSLVQKQQRQANGLPRIDGETGATSWRVSSDASAGRRAPNGSDCRARKAQ